MREFEEWYVFRSFLFPHLFLLFSFFSLLFNIFTIFSQSLEYLLLSDEYCPHCDNHFLLDAKVPKSTSKSESATDVRVDSSMLKDYRVEGDRQRSRFDEDYLVDRLG